MKKGTDGRNNFFSEKIASLRVFPPHPDPLPPGEEGINGKTNDK
jgi:hypothetical protein